MTAKELYKTLCKQNLQNTEIKDLKLTTGDLEIKFVVDEKKYIFLMFSWNFGKK